MRLTAALALGMGTTLAASSAWAQADQKILDFTSNCNCFTNTPYGYTCDDGTMIEVTCPGGVLTLKWDQSSDYWYSVLYDTGHNLQAYDYLTFRVRASSPTTRINLNMRDADDAWTGKILNSYFPDGLPLFWSTATIPIADFFDQTNSSAVKAFSLDYGYPATGTVTNMQLEVDDFYLRRETQLKVVAASFVSSDTVNVYFNVPVGASGDIAANYSLSPSISVTNAARRDNDRAARLTLASALAINTTYTVTVAGVTGRNGATLGSQDTGVFIGHNYQAWFADDFNRPPSQGVRTDEMPAGPWSPGGWVDPGNWVALSTNTRLYGASGLFAYDASTTTLPSGAGARVERTLSPTASRGYLRFYFMIPQSFWDNTTADASQSIACLNSELNGRYICLIAVKEGSARYVYFETYNSLGAYSGGPAYTNLQPGRWYAAEIHGPPAGSAATVVTFIDGKRNWKAATDFSDIGSWGYVFAGLGWAANNAWQRGMYIDELYLSTRTYVGQIEKPPELLSATVIDQNKVRLYFDRAVSTDNAAWTDAANFSINPPLSITSVGVEDDYRAVALNTADQQNGVDYRLTMNPSLISGAKNTASFVGVNPTVQVIEDFNRPDNGWEPRGFRETDSPVGPWSYYIADGANKISISSESAAAFRGDFGLKAEDLDSTSGALSAAFAKTNVDAPGAVRARFYVYLTSAFFTNLGAGNNRLLGRFGGSTTSCVSASPCAVYVMARNEGGTPSLVLEIAHNTGWAATSPVTITTDRWNAVEVLAPSTGTSVIAWFWINNSVAGSISADVSNGGYWKQFDLGLLWTGNATSVQTAWFDELQVSQGGLIGTIPGKPPFWSSPKENAGSTGNRRPKLWYYHPTNSEQGTRTDARIEISTSVTFEAAVTTAAQYSLSALGWSGIPSGSGATVYFTPQLDLVANTTTLYLRARTLDGDSTWSNWSASRRILLRGDWAWTDPSLIVGTTTVRAVHAGELRQVVGYVRPFRGFSDPVWTDDPILAGTTTVRSAHISELRSQLEPVLTDVGEPFSWTDPTIYPGTTTIRAAHFNELRTKSTVP